MSLRTRRGSALLASLLFVVAACSPNAASPNPTTTGAASAPSATTGASETGASMSPSGSGSASASGESPSASESGSASASGESPSASESGSASASGESGSPSASGSPPSGKVELFNTDYPNRFKEGQPGGQVIVADWQEANLFNPYFFNQVTEADVNAAFASALLVSTDDFKYAPDLAAEIPTLDNGGVKAPGSGGDKMTVTWKLRDGLKWSDGEALGCEDFDYTLGWIMNKDVVGLPAGKTGYEDITKIDCTSATEMVWHFKNVYEGYLTLFPTGPLPKHYMSKVSIKDAVTGKGYLATELPNTPVNGPFKFESVTPGQEIRMVRNENYTSTRHQGPAYLDTLIFKWYQDADTMIAAAKGGSPEYDIAKDLNEADLPKLADMGDQVKQLTGLTYEFLRPNWSKDKCSTRVPDRGKGCPMSDPAMREALKYGIDREDINKRLLGGAAAIGWTNVSPNAWFYVEPTEKAGYDAERAAKALDDAGWKADKDTGMRSKGDLKAKVELCTTTREVRQSTLALISSKLGDLGIATVISPVSPSDIFASYNESTDQTPCDLSRYNYDIAEHAFSVPLDPLSNYPVYHSSQLEPEGGNDGAVQDKGLDKALETVKNSVDFEVVKKAMADFQKIYVEKTVEIPLYFRKEVYIVSPKVQNFTGNPTSNGPLWNVGDWWVQQ